MTMSDINELWTQVRRLVLHMAHKRLRATSGTGGVTLDDLTQAGFLGFLRAVETFDPGAGAKFSTWLVYYVRSAFDEAQGRRKSPLDLAVSLDAPIEDDEPFTLSDLIADPRAEIAAATGQTEKEVRKLEAKAIRALRHPSVSRALR